MGNKKKLNRKKRQSVTTEIDNTETLKIKVDLDVGKEKFDECNQLILPSKKRPTKIRKEEAQKVKVLSKAQRKKLEKIVNKKKKKSNRTLLLEALAQVQAPLEELNQLTSVASVQTRGLKRHFAESKNGTEIIFLQSGSEKKQINSIKGSSRKRRRILATESNENLKIAETDPNIVGFENLSSSDSDNDSDTTPVTSNNDIEILKEVDNGNEECEILKSNSFKPEVTQETKIELDTLTENNGKDLVKNNVPLKAIKKEPVDTQKSCPAVFIHVERDPEIQSDRLKLPILGEEQVIMEAINENDVVIIAGETGSGKTTQVPQFLYEAGYNSHCKMIGITQPRRVAAISMSKRVAKEMNLTSDVVSYLIRFEGNSSSNTKIKFMTDGVLLKEIQTDFALSSYSVIILDEAHERNIYTDILIGLLSRIVPLRKKRNDPLKLIIMSATLRVEDFTENTRLFKKSPPIIKVDTRQFPVTTYFNKKTSDNYVKDCFLKTCKIHSKLPEGGILVFVTGQMEVNYLVKKLQKTFPLNQGNKKVGREENLKEILKKAKPFRKQDMKISDIKIDLDKYSIVPNDDTEIEELEGDDDLGIFNDDFDCSADIIKISAQQPLWVLPMYSLLPSAEQAKVFEKPPEGCRLCVVSTNVAETSLTIPNIKYVVDSGKTKTKLYDKTTGVTRFQITWCSKASANQRAGRAGRMGPGHCYRLYSSAVFNDEFPEFSIPEIQQKPIDDLMLQMKAMNIVKVLNFPFPTSPDILQLKSSENRLKILGALEEPTGKDKWSSKLTALGKTMATFPVSPRFAKMLALSYQHNLLQYTVCIVAALSVPEVLLNDQGENKWSELHRTWAGLGNSLLLGDVMVLLRAVGAAEYCKDNLEEFCLKNGLRFKALREIRKLRVQLTNQINLNIPELNLMVDPNLKPPTDTQAKLLRQIILSGLTDHVAHKVNLDEIKDNQEKMKWKKAYRDSEMESPIFLHSTSVLKSHMPDWVVYQEVYETNKLYMRGVTAIEPEWLSIFAPSLCALSEPLPEPPPKFDFASGKILCHVNGTFGRAAFTLPTMEIPLINGLVSYKWFAKFFLEGEVFTKLKKYVDNLLSAPSVMTKSWARLQPRTQILLSALVTHETNTRNKILEIWKIEPFYLLDAYKAWLPESAHESVTSIWPPV